MCGVHVKGVACKKVDIHVSRFVVELRSNRHTASCVGNYIPGMKNLRQVELTAAT